MVAVRLFAKIVKDRKAATDTIMSIGTALIVIAISAIIFGYVVGVGSNLTNSITNTTIKDQTNNFLSQLVTFGFSMYNFAILLVLAMVAAVLIAYFKEIKGGGGGGV